MTHCNRFWKDKRITVDCLFLKPIKYDKTKYATRLNFKINKHQTSTNSKQKKNEKDGQKKNGKSVFKFFCEFIKVKKLSENIF
jgi:hypothetical protein